MQLAVKAKAQSLCRRKKSATGHSNWVENGIFHLADTSQPKKRVEPGLREKKQLGKEDESKRGFGENPELIQHPVHDN
jgi:hypothetical protein